MMKKLLILLFSLTLAQSFAQTTKEKTQNVPINRQNNRIIDTALRVIYVDKNKSERTSAVFINGKYVTNSIFLSTFKMDYVENIEIISRDTLIENISFGSQLYIKTKDNYMPKFISLTAVKDKYTNLKGKTVIFTIDGDFINENYDACLVDENHLLTIIVDKFEIAKEKKELGLIKILTKSQKNLEDRNQIMLRGVEAAKNK